MPRLFRPEVRMQLRGMSMVVENIILLRYVELRARLCRLISILKVRESGYDNGLREFAIGDSGIDLAPTFETAVSILGGNATIAPMNSRDASGGPAADDHGDHTDRR